MSTLSQTPEPLASPSGLGFLLHKCSLEICSELTMRTPEAEDGLAEAFPGPLMLTRTFPSAGTETETHGLS